MAVIPLNYPSGCSIEEILKVINDLSQEIIASGGDINKVLRFVPIINIGQAELQKRILEKSNKIVDDLHKETKQLKEIAELNSKSSEVYAKATQYISIIALVISVIAVFISSYFSTKADRSSQIWQSEQLNILKDLDKNTIKGLILKKNENCHKSR